MKHLRAVNKYFWKYRMRFLWGLVFIILSNYFRILTPQITGYVVNSVEKELRETAIRRNGGVGRLKTQVAENRELTSERKDSVNYDILVKKFIKTMDISKQSFA